MDPFSSAVDLASAIRSRELSPVEVTEAYLARIDRHDPAVNAFVRCHRATVRARAEEAERAVLDGRRLPPLHGVPIPLKEMTQVEGEPATYCSLGIGDAPREVTEPVVTRLLDAGLIPMGRTNSPEMGMLTDTDNRRFGQTRNPWNTAHSPGGSSGGAAAAVAAGMAPVAHANDGGGSIRMPSSACGLVGLKPSRGRVPQLAAAWEHSTVEGAITRYVRDTAALLDAMSVPDRLAMYQAPPPARPFSDEVGRDAGRLRIGLLTSAPTGLPVEPECVAAAEHTAHLLESLGHRVEGVAPRFFSEEAFGGYARTVLDASLWAVPFDRPDLAAPHLRHRRERAEGRHSGHYTRAVALLQRESREVVAQWERDFDVLLTPTMACAPPEAGRVLKEADGDPEGPRVTETQMISFTSICNVTGLPAISLPTYRSAAGLPVGSQLIAGPWDEAVLIRLASALEEAEDWTARRPAGFSGPTS
ncbi:amidase [Nocardiopsis sp. YSL2]|uniref:amidase n=1 Tax=Nocardiopsis sp. YSL2 TaxID=2939492 RepID=UPI0026F41380|nr:amidase [Nocardiopsis sp. YSL2]